MIADLIFIITTISKLREVGQERCFFDLEPKYIRALHFGLIECPYFSSA
jgi:hypothetical protein